MSITAIRSQYKSKLKTNLIRQALFTSRRDFAPTAQILVETVGASRRQGRLWRRFRRLRSLTAVFRVSFFPSYTRIRTLHSWTWLPFCLFPPIKNGPCGPFYWWMKRYSNLRPISRFPLEILYSDYHMLSKCDHFRDY